MKHARYRASWGRMAVLVVSPKIFHTFSLGKSTKSGPASGIQETVLTMSASMACARRLALLVRK